MGCDIYARIITGCVDGQHSVGFSGRNRRRRRKLTDAVADTGTGDRTRTGKAYESIILPAVSAGCVLISMETGCAGSEEDLAGNHFRLRRGSCWFVVIPAFRDGTTKETIWWFTDSDRNPGIDVQTQKQKHTGQKMRTDHHSALSLAITACLLLHMEVGRLAV